MAAAARAAESEGLTLLSDSSWPGYFDLPHRLMEGYLAMADEISRQMAEAPTHVFLQAGVGGLADQSGVVAGLSRLNVAHDQSATIPCAFPGRVLEL